MIDRYRFGHMEIQGRIYTADLIIHADLTIQPSWWRKQGHRLALEDLSSCLAKNPQVIVVGTGASGLLKPEPGLDQLLARQGVRFMARPTAEAATLFNDLLGRGERVAGCFHLTC